jgi:hypothetical protein
MEKLKIILLWMLFSVLTGALISWVFSWELYKCVIVSIICMGLNFFIGELLLYLGLLSQRLIDAKRKEKI